MFKISTFPIPNFYQLPGSLASNSVLQFPNIISQHFFQMTVDLGPQKGRIALLLFTTNKNNAVKVSEFLKSFMLK